MQTGTGRSCPIDYRYIPQQFAQAVAKVADPLYVVGGLYGNNSALDALAVIYEQEPAASIVFNGDFNWFNVDPDHYRQVNRRVLEFEALRGNVETELGHAEDRGCGCDYPTWVDDSVVLHSNQIMRRLKQTAVLFPDISTSLAALPSSAVYRVGDVRVAVVHGDAEALSGWGFSQEMLADSHHRQRVRAWFELGAVDVYACSHTCLPVLQRIASGDDGADGWVVNNGAAGMPNFKDTGYGLITRIATSRCDRVESVYGIRADSVFIDAVPLRYDQGIWRAQFLRDWRPESAAYISYFSRITVGPEYRREQALRPQ